MKFKKKLLKKIIRKIGIERINNILANHGVKYELSKRGANYFYYYWRKAKKKIDLKKLPEFWEIASTIVNEKRTTLFYDRLYTIWQAVLNIPTPDLSIAEVGTYRGGSAKFILEIMKKHGFNNNFFVFDTFEGHVIVDKELDDQQQLGDFNDVSYEEVKAYIGSTDVSIHKGNFIDTAKFIDKKNRFGFVHIDVDVYPVTNFCLYYFKDLTIPGSLIVVDDYGNPSCKGLKKAVDEFVIENSDFKLFYLMTGQALIIKIGNK